VFPLRVGHVDRPSYGETVNIARVCAHILRNKIGLHKSIVIAIWHQ